MSEAFLRVAPGPGGPVRTVVMDRAIESKGWLIADWIGVSLCLFGIVIKLVFGLPPSWITVVGAVAAFYLGRVLIRHYAARQWERQHPVDHICGECRL